MRRRRSTPMIDRQWGVPTQLGSRIPLASLIQTLAVAEYLNIRHAANALRTSQSSVSARIKALEEELGILLFERNTRGVRLTEAGRLFVERVSAVTWDPDLLRFRRESWVLFLASCGLFFQRRFHCELGWRHVAESRVWSLVIVVLLP